MHTTAHTTQQPVHGGVDVVGRGLGDAQVLGERGRLPPARRGQLGSWPHRPCHHESERQVPLGAGRAQDLGQAELPGHRPGGSDVAVGQAALEQKASPAATSVCPARLARTAAIASGGR